MTKLSRAEMAKVSANRTHEVVGAMHGAQNRGCMAASFLVFLIIMAFAAVVAHSKSHIISRTNLSNTN